MTNVFSVLLDFVELSNFEMEQSLEKIAIFGGSIFRDEQFLEPSYFWQSNTWSQAIF